VKAIGKDHELIKLLRKHNKRNIRDGLVIVEELGVLEKYLLSERKGEFSLVSLIVCEELITSEYAKIIKDELISIAKDSYSVSPKTYELVVEKKNSAGIVAVLEWREFSKEEIRNSGYRTVIVLDGLENPGNVGTILRTADAAGTDVILAVDLKTNVYGKKAVSASRGMLFEIPVLTLDYESAQNILLDAGYRIYLGEPKIGEDFSKVKYAEKTAVVLGSERFGINETWYSCPHEKIYIPMMGLMTSLNVGVAASLIMYEIMRQK